MHSDFKFLKLYQQFHCSGLLRPKYAWLYSWNHDAKNLCFAEKLVENLFILVLVSLKAMESILKAPAAK